ncbi:SDR family oxidoreductase [Actinomadura formosensis]|uniref:SDR family oxidoreductase n=1 Tax=Actinomadura formosensis TaxID=60706 RepID=UPI001F5F6B5F|nr:SDR family oxidoreductase [Actinomadura formosensis]
MTGAARGIGAAIAGALVADGARVVIGDILDGEGEELAERLGDGAVYVHLDVTDSAHWQAALAEAERLFGPVSVLVNNAGIVEFGGIADQPADSFRRVIDINLYGAWLGMRTALPSLRRAGGGCIVNISSTAGLMGYANLGAYTASKWGLRGLTKTAALELAADGVRVCSVHPGPIRTPMTSGMDDSLTAGQPIPRFGEPEEVAQMVHFIITRATYSTGSEFVVDGGAATGITPPVNPST